MRQKFFEPAFLDFFSAWNQFMRPILQGPGDGVTRTQLKQGNALVDGSTDRHITVLNGFMNFAKRCFCYVFKRNLLAFFVAINDDF